MAKLSSMAEASRAIEEEEEAVQRGRAELKRTGGSRSVVPTG